MRRSIPAKNPMVNDLATFGTGCTNVCPASVPVKVHSFTDGLRTARRQSEGVTTPGSLPGVVTVVRVRVVVGVVAGGATGNLRWPGRGRWPCPSPRP